MKVMARKDAWASTYFRTAINNCIEADELLARITALCAILRENGEMCGFCYTQFTDVMQEMNGVFTYDRRPKLPLEKLHKAIAGE